MADNHMHDIATGKLYRALLRLMDEKPFSEISVSELSHRAGTSRMAFYRNYKSIGDILLQHIEEQMLRYTHRCSQLEQLTERSIWVEFFAELKHDALLPYLNRANLTDEIIQIHKKAAFYVYRELFHMNFTEQKNVILLYQRIGSMMGILLYLNDYPQDSDPEQLADMVLSMVAGDVLIQIEPQ